MIPSSDFGKSSVHRKLLKFLVAITLADLVIEREAKKDPTKWARVVSGRVIGLFLYLT